MFPFIFINKDLSRAIQPISISLGQENFHFCSRLLFTGKIEEKIDVVGNPGRRSNGLKGKKEARQKLGLLG